MVKVTVCIGSSCHLKGSRQVVEQLQYLIRENNLSDDINLAGAFCMGKCQEKGVNITIDNKSYSISPSDVDSFFNNKILTKVSK